MTTEVTFDEFRPAIDTLTLYASTLPVPVSLAVVRAVIATMAAGEPSSTTSKAIVDAITVFKALHSHIAQHPDPELPPGWKGTVAWWSKATCEALFAPVALAVVEGHLRTLAENASRSDDPSWRQMGEYAAALANDVLVPQASALFGD